MKSFSEYEIKTTTMNEIKTKIAENDNLLFKEIMNKDNPLFKRIEKENEFLLHIKCYLEDEAILIAEASKELEI